MSYTTEEILEIAKAQKYVLYCIFVNLIPGFMGIFFAFSVFVLTLNLSNTPFAENPDLPKSIEELLTIFSAVLWIFQTYCLYRIIRSLKDNSLFLWMLGIILPVGLIALFILFFQAASVIKVAGFKVELMGADLNEIRTKLES